MPDLPGSNPEKDKKMIREILNCENYKPDYLKIYPCLDVDFTEIRKWKQIGRWKPYADEDPWKMLDVCLEAKIHSKYHTRFNRIQRDFPEERQHVLGYKSEHIRSNFRQTLLEYAKKNGIRCKCIRCMEVKTGQFVKDFVIHQEVYKASGGTEYFISVMNKQKSTLFGFVRLRINNKEKKKVDFYFPELKDLGLIRELHVYGNVVSTKGKNNGNTQTQHKGLGKMLVKKAEKIAFQKGLRGVAVISGVGVRSYYRKLGYQLYFTSGEYMIKKFAFSLCQEIWMAILGLLLLSLLCFS
jgi:ELP3 family radical SAM enzyme/protein acetyltransferase